MMRDYMKALCCRFETTSRRAEYLDRKIERTRRQLTRQLDEPERIRKNPADDFVKDLIGG